MEATNPQRQIRKDLFMLHVGGTAKTQIQHYTNIQYLQTPSLETPLERKYVFLSYTWDFLSNLLAGDGRGTSHRGVPTPACLAPPFRGVGLFQVTLVHFAKGC